MMETLNLWAAWIGILLGMLSGAAQGLFFHRADWLDGYGSWPRRLIRLGQISLFRLAFVNRAYCHKPLPELSKQRITGSLRLICR